MKKLSTETETLRVQVLGILSGLSGLGRDVHQTSESPSGQLLMMTSSYSDPMWQ